MPTNFNYPQNNYGAQGNYGAQSNYGASGAASSGEIPKKFVKIDGIMKRNPEYDAYLRSQGQQSPSAGVVNNELALPVLTGIEDHQAFNEVLAIEGDPERPLAESTDATIDMMQDSEIARDVGLPPDAIVEELGEVFAKYEVPMGLMNKLYMLSEYDTLEFIIDDSGSMNSLSDTRDSNGNQQTRWQEAQSRMKDLVEILAYVPTQDITISFFNRGGPQSLKHNKGEAPQQYIQRAHSLIDSAFSNRPSGTTPALETLQRSFNAGQGKSISRYFFCDGVPNGGERAKRKIGGLIQHRSNPQQNPITFMSCSEQDSDVEWMKDLEEIAPFAAEYDDYASEAQEVFGDQGQALPFTRGFYLVAQLVGAANPDDLDAMDESVPFTKTTLDNLLGYQTSEEEYSEYFKGFLGAQQNKQPKSGDANERAMAQVRKSMNWQSLYNELLRKPVANKIPEVQAFKDRLKAAGLGNAGGYDANHFGNTGGYSQGGHNQGGYGNQYNNGGNQNGGSHKGFGNWFGGRV